MLALCLGRMFTSNTSEAGWLQNQRKVQLPWEWTFHGNIVRHYVTKCRDNDPVWCEQHSLCTFIWPTDKPTLWFRVNTVKSKETMPEFRFLAKLSHLATVQTDSMYTFGSRPILYVSSWIPKDGWHRNLSGQAELKVKRLLWGWLKLYATLREFHLVNDWRAGDASFGSELIPQRLQFVL